LAELGSQPIKLLLQADAGKLNFSFRRNDARGIDAAAQTRLIDAIVNATLAMIKHDVMPRSNLELAWILDLSLIDDRDSAVMAEFFLSF
jgi:hypothetical protein